MRQFPNHIMSIAVFTVLALGGCANNGNGLTTASLVEQDVAKTSKFDPACVSLTAKIDGLRKEGTMARLAKVSEGKTRSTLVKRAALAKAAELDRANAEFQAKCSTFKPTTTARATTAVQHAVVKSATTAAKKKATAAAVKTAVKAVKK